MRRVNDGYGIDRRAPAQAGGAMLRPDLAGAGVDLADIVAILRRRAWMIALALMATTGLALAYLVVTKPLYSASVSFLVDARSRPPIGSEAQPPPQTPDAALVESQVKLIASDTVLRRVVEWEKLDADMEFAPTTPGLRTRLFALVGLARIDSGPADLKLRALDALQRAVTVKRSERTYVIDVEVATREPDKSARIANAIARAYIADLQAASAASAERSETWLRGRLAELQGRVEAAERRAQAFREENGLVNANGKSVSELELADLSAQLTAARARASETRARWEQTRRLSAGGRTPDGVGDGLKSGVMERLRQQQAEIIRQESNFRTTLGPRHPAYIEVQQQLADTNRLIQEEARRLVDVARSEHDSARTQEKALETRLSEAKGQSATDGKALVRLREFEREVEASRIVYEKFLRARETVKEDTLETPLARVISPAVAPLAPSSPKKVAILAMALAAGLGFGIGAALAVDFLDPASPVRRERRGADARTLPAARRPEAHPDLIGRLDAPAPAAAPTRDWRTRLTRWRRPAADAPPAPDPVDALLDEIRAGDRPAHSLLVSGLDPLDAEARGRSTLALARAAARRGERVLIVAADRHSPALAAADPAPAALLDCDGERRSLHAIAADAAQANGGLWVLPRHVSGLAARRARAARRDLPLIAGMRQGFDLVLFDGPDGDDDLAADLAAAADRTLIVAGPGDDAETIDAAIDFVEAAGGVFAGVALAPAAPAPQARAA